MPMHTQPPRARLPGLILDLDGTIYLGDEPIPGAPETVTWLQREGYPVVFATNNLEHRREMTARLLRMGVIVQEDDILHAPLAVRFLLEQEVPGAKLFVIGLPCLREQLAETFALTDDPEQAQAVVVSFDDSFGFQQLVTAFRALRRGARFFATNADPTWPTPQGELPDSGALIAALEVCSGRRLEAIAGKPSPWIGRAALARLRLRPQDTWIVGDSLATDMGMGRELGLTTALVLTGVTNRSALQDSPWQPSYTLESLSDLPSLLSKGQAPST
jgi:HAD superfamily hydrolase (TIGR01450 family)